MARNGGPKTGGRKSGTPNKNNKLLYEMIDGALEAVGGQDYLETQAIANPVAFLTLLGKRLPKDMNITGDAPFVVKIVKFSDEHTNS
jgi:hypothetical protein